MTAAEPASPAMAAAEMHPEPIWSLDAEGCFTWLNLAAQEWLGRSQRALSGRLVQSLGPSVGELPDLVMRAIADERTVVARQLMVRDRLVDVHLRWLGPEEGILVCILPGTPTDATSDHAPALGFGRMLAHELKNPLASIRGAAQLIKHGGGQSADADMAGLIIADVDRIARLADHWSGVGDITLKTEQAVNLNRIVMTAIENVRRANADSPVVIRDELDPSLPQGFGDADMLGQLVINLIQNAIDACAAGEAPEVVIRTGYSGPTRGNRAGKPVPLAVRVQDNGPGIPASLQPNIFTPFVTSKPAGEGLGLAFSARIAELHKGMLDFETRPGRTVFSLRLPQDTEQE